MVTRVIISDWCGALGIVAICNGSLATPILVYYHDTSAESDDNDIRGDFLLFLTMGKPCYMMCVAFWHKFPLCNRTIFAGK